jgi:hypothetical protein
MQLKKAHITTKVTIQSKIWIRMFIKNSLLIFLLDLNGIKAFYSMYFLKILKYLDSFKVN